MLIIGSHHNINNGIIAAKNNIINNGGNCMQIFTSPPQSLHLGPLFSCSENEYKNIIEQTKGFPIFIHSKYILNFAKPLIPKNKIFLVRYVQDLNLSHKLHMQGVILHFGTASNSLTRTQARNNMAKSLISCLDHADPKTIPILETSSGEGNYLGRTIETMNTILLKLPTKYQKRIKFCIDTCHIFVSGYPIHKPGGWNAYVKQFQSVIGKKIAVIHLNDSATPFDGKNDRHDTIGEGYIFDEKKGGSLIALKEILQWADKNNIPCILETPGNPKKQIQFCKKILNSQTGGSYKLLDAFRELMNYHKALNNIHQFQAYKNIVNKLSKINQIKSINDVQNLEGFGKGTIDKINEFFKTGKISVLEDMKKNNNLNALVNLQKVYGIGPKFAQELIKLNIHNINELKNAYKSGKIKLNEHQIAGIKYFDDLNSRIPLKNAQEIIEFLQKIIGKKNVLLMGGFRLGKKDGKDIDIVIINNNYEDIMAKIEPYIVKILESGHNMITALMKFPNYNKIIHVDLRIAPKNKEAFYTLYFGSGENFSRKIREHAKKMGYKLNEHGLQKNGKYIQKQFKSEKDIFKFLNFPFINPPNRI